MLRDRLRHVARIAIDGVRDVVDALVQLASDIYAHLRDEECSRARLERESREGWVRSWKQADYRLLKRMEAENQQLKQELRDQERTLQHLVQTNHALNDELAAAKAELERVRPVVDAARRFVQALDATEASIRPDPEGVIDGPHGQALRAAVAALDAAREEATA